MDSGTYEFGSFKLIPAQRLLLKDGVPLQLGGRALDILTVLVESAGRTVSNSQIMARAWPTTVVEDGSLRVHIGALRRTLGDDRAGNRFIANIPGQGYVFVAQVGHGASALPVMTAPPVSPPTQPASSLPTQLVSVIGRDAAIAGLAAQLGRHRLLTIVGAGGMGKTTVAVAVGETVTQSYHDGVWFVPLAPLATPDLVASAVAAALGVSGTGPDPLPGVTAWLRDRQALILLDNCEHVIDAVAVVAETILRAAPKVSILATSREPLRAEGERLYRLAPLEVPPSRLAITADEALSHSAVQLFQERARAYGSSFAFTDAEAPALSEICRKLDGLPLALELAAAQVGAIGIQGLAQGLSHRFALLNRGRRTALRRQQTLRATMDWSHDLLPETEQIVLRRLSVFRGEFTMAAASAVVGEEQLADLSMVENIGRLVVKSLIVSDISGDITYYRLLDTTRAYAQEKLAESGDNGRLRRRHAEYYRDLLAGADSERGSLPRTEWTAIYGRHIDNVRASLDWAFSPDGDPDIGVALAIATVPLWTELSLLSECREWVEQALANLDQNAPETVRARMQLSAAHGWSLMYGVARAREARSAWTTTLELAERLDDASYRQRALWSLCIDQFNNGKASIALDFARRFAALVDGSADPLERMMADRILATSLHYLGDQRSARHHIDRALAHDAAPGWQAHMVGSRSDLLVSTHYFQARILWLQGFADQSLQVVTHNIEEGRTIGQPLWFCSVLGQAACPIAYLAGDLAKAETYGAMLVEHTERYPVRLWNIWAHCFNGLVLAAKGDAAQGLRELRDGLETAGDARFLPRFLLLQGEQTLLLGKVGAAGPALTLVDALLSQCEARDEGWYIPELLRIKGELTLALELPDSTDQVEALFQLSLDRAHRQGALSWELRTAMSLARMWRANGRHADAAALLRPIHARFTEGFATTDLRAAESLLTTG